MIDDPATAVFEGERPRLLGLAYRLLGSVADAEDVVQETWLRWQRVDRAAVQTPAAWLTTVCSRVGLDLLRARQRDRSDYVGPWLPEPLVAPASSTVSDPESVAEMSDSLTTSFLVMLETLTPEERLGVLLVDVFGEPFETVGGLIGRSASTSRQLVARARRKLRSGTQAAHVDPRSSAMEVARRLAAAVIEGDVDAVQRLLAPEVVLLSDGGKHHRAARRPVVTVPRVSRFLVNIGARLVAVGDAVELSETTINGAPALVVRLGGVTPVFAQAMDVVDGRVVRIHTFLNPDKLRSLDLTPRLT
ncbi:MAG: RNA polymerase sigma factor SigJ [Ilumatobacteraceae bacterium]